VDAEKLVRQKWRLLKATMDERARRLWAGIEAGAIGHGGVAGLVVRARLDRRHYPVGKKVSAREMRAIRIEPNDFHGDWNYSILPRTAPD
jgi:hypothetical protein